MDFQGKKIAFLGDSITEGIAATKPENIYHAVLGKMWDAKVYNYGISGTRFAKQHTPSAAPSFDMDFVSRTDDISSECDTVFVFGGTNDFGHGDAPFGTLDDTTQDTFCGACRVLFSKLASRFGSENTFCILPLHRLEEANLNGDGCKPIPSRPLIDYVNAEKTIAVLFGIKIIDLWNGALNPNKPDGVQYFADSVHPSDAGHRRLALEIDSAIKEL